MEHKIGHDSAGKPPSAEPLAFTVSFDPVTECRKHLKLKGSLNTYAPASRLKHRVRQAPPKSCHNTDMGKGEEVDSIKLPVDVCITNEVFKTSSELVEDGASDTGTYTIDQEEDEYDTKRELQAIEKLIIGTEHKSQSKEERIMDWASKTAGITPVNDTTIFKGEMSSKERRKLPATPQCQQGLSSLQLLDHSQECINHDDKKGYNSDPNDKRAEETSFHATAIFFKSGDRRDYEETSSDTSSAFDNSSLPGNAPSSSSWSGPNNSVTKTNRAFALRRKMNSDRSAKCIGHEKMRGIPKSERVKKTEPTVVIPTSHPKKQERSSSSLTTREVHFQAWKRRQKYNPLEATMKSFIQKDNEAASREMPTKKDKVATQSHSSSDIPLKSTFFRSASFHYPDGLSSRQHNVYKSDDETDCAIWRHRRDTKTLLEVANDELFLPLEVETDFRRPSSSACPEFDNLVISTILSISSKLCLSSANILKKIQAGSLRSEDPLSDTMICILEDKEPDCVVGQEPTKQLTYALRNLKKVEQALKMVDNLYY